MRFRRSPNAIGNAMLMFEPAKEARVVAGTARWLLQALPVEGRGATVGLPAWEDGHTGPSFLLGRIVRPARFRLTRSPAARLATPAAISDVGPMMGSISAVCQPTAAFAPNSATDWPEWRPSARSGRLEPDADFRLVTRRKKRADDAICFLFHARSQ